MPPTFESLQVALGDRYAFDREVGAGGMATVFLARDRKHDRQVAVKVLRQELAQALGRDRFLREIRIVANLQHPNILPLHDSGEAGGFLFYVMPFVEGESLRTRIEREGALPVAVASRILAEVADALGYAHRHGIVHRDIKPENIMLSGRHAVVTDFGVAKAVSDAANAQDKMTTAGVALGTPFYMSPEQAVADPNTDHRADIYALGVIAYELFTGKPPFHEGGAQAVLSAHVVTEAPPITRTQPNLPPALAKVVMRCLEKKPENRFQTADELLPAFESFATPSGGITPTNTRPIEAVRRGPGWRRWAGIAAGVAVVGIGAALALRGRGGSAAAEAPRPIRRLAVLPIADASGAGATDPFANGLLDALINRLAQVAGPIVVPRSSVMRYQHTDKTMAEVARELNADAVIEGSMLRDGARLRINAQLIEVATDRPLWSQSYERQVRDVLALQDSLARQMAEEIRAALPVSPTSQGRRGP
ncbi:MAG: serine/threonine-protein kinase [Gemmatimonadales bacterium]|nr:serine/threonine-protein kinase [Gemmatimonadales bacterium]